MQQLLITGVDSVVGGNLAAHLADNYRITGVSSCSGVSIEGCETLAASIRDRQAIDKILDSCSPDHVVVCHAAGDSCWHQVRRHSAARDRLGNAELWIRAAANTGARVTFISSDAVFTGPWMFHTESSGSLCPSGEARALRDCESLAIESGANALVVRTHAYGWSPVTDRLGWIEGILASLESDRPGVFEYVPHATPILATDLADILKRAWESKLQGLYHVAGAERTNPYQFVCALARIFEGASPRPQPLSISPVPGRGYAQGESSLHTRKIRHALGIAMPLLADGLETLREQRDTGRDRFRPTSPLRTSKVA